jgi:hypothetical protein
MVRKEIRDLAQSAMHDICERNQPHLLVQAFIKVVTIGVLKFADVVGVWTVVLASSAAVLCKHSTTQASDLLLQLRYRLFQFFDFVAHTVKIVRVIVC